MRESFPKHDSGTTGVLFEHEVWGDKINIPNWNFKEAVDLKISGNISEYIKRIVQTLMSSGFIKGNSVEEATKNYKRLKPQEQKELLLEHATKFQPEKWDSENPNTDKKHAILGALHEAVDEYILNRADEEDILLNDLDRVHCYNLLQSPVDIAFGSDGVFKFGGVWVTVDTTKNSQKNERNDIRELRSVIFRDEGLLDEDGNIQKEVIKRTAKIIGNDLFEGYCLQNGIDRKSLEKAA